MLEDKSSDTYTENLNEHDILKKFMDILKHFNDIVKTNPLIVHHSDLLRYKRKYVKFKTEFDHLTQQTNFHDIDMLTEVNEPESFCPSPRRKRCVLNIPLSKKTRFNVYIFKKIHDLETELEHLSDEMEYFYIKYKKYYDRFSISTIIMSSSLSLIQGAALMVRPTLNISVVTLVLSTTIVISTTVLKFKNYKEKIELIVKMTEKIYTCQSKLYTFDKYLKALLNMSDDTSLNINDS
jgi:hypothetical protein